MSLYSALFTGVSGLNTQGQKLGIISDNIANVNTIGYKRAEASFKTLVVNTSGASSYSPGGALVSTRYEVDKQGILASTAAPTDIAISGQGFFVVSSTTDAGSQPLYTRAGSFRQDADGDFVNAAGFYLRAWPLDQEGRLPGEVGNLNTASSSDLQSLEVVNAESVKGEPAATKQVDVSFNLDAKESVYPGEGVLVDMDATSTANANIGQKDIIVPDETDLTGTTPPSFGLAPTNGIVRGDKFSISTGSGLEYTYEYGGFSMSRKITSNNLATNIGDASNDLSPNQLAVGGEIAVANNSNTFTITTAAAHGLNPGDQIRVSSFTFAAGGNVPLSEINTVHTLVAPTAGTTLTFQTTSTNTGGADVNSAVPVTTWTTRLFSGNILDASSETQKFIDATTLSDFTNNAKVLTVTTGSGEAITFTYNSEQANAASGQFNNLSNLAEAMNASSFLTARVVDGRLVVGAEDANDSLTFANGDATGTSTLRGIDWVAELDLADVAAGSRRFSTKESLAELVNADDGVSATFDSNADDADLALRVDDPLDTVRFQDFESDPVALGAGVATVAAGAGGVPVNVTITYPGHGLRVGSHVTISGMADFDGIADATDGLNATHTVTAITANTITFSITPVGATAAGPGNTDGNLAFGNVGSLLSELGVSNSLGIAPMTLANLSANFVRGDTTDLGPEYDPTGVVGQNMASGDITPQFTESMRIYDALGTGHDIAYSFIKIDTNEWAVEVYAVNENEINSTLSDGQIATGTIRFNGDGTLASISSSLTSAATINWTNGAADSNLTIDWGTAGLPIGTEGALSVGDIDGLQQFDADYKKIEASQDGAPVGDLASITIDADGFVIASFTNGENKRIWKIPVADFANPNGLLPISGNVYAETFQSGDLILRQAGRDGVGKIEAGALEQSNVDLARELTDMIVAQRAYQANTRVISTTDELLEQLNQL